MFHADHRAHAHRCARAFGKHWQVRAAAIAVGVIGGMLTPQEPWLKFIAGVIAACTGGLVLYWIPWLFYLFFDSVGAVHYAEKSAKRKSDRDHLKTIRGTTRTLLEIQERLNAKPDPLSAWMSDTPLDVQDATIALMMPIGPTSKTTLGDVLGEMRIQAGSVGVTSLDLRTNVRERGESQEWNRPYVWMEMLVSSGVLAPAGGVAFSQGVSCVLTPAGRTALSSISRLPPELLARFRNQTKADDQANPEAP